MGIQGLLPFLSEATENTHISKFRGGTVAVDSYCWLHKGANACAEQIVRGDDTDVFVNYCLKYVRMLTSYDIHVIMVFDGKNLPAKAETELKRREQRQKAKQRSAELLRLGKVDEARNTMKQAIDITPQMAHKLVEECRKLKNVDCIVAPYESDAQLAFFSINDIADCIITEDSDLILFGCKKVMYKMDMTGAGQLVVTEKINNAMKLRPDVYSFDKFRFMCILSGCDYLSSLSGIGLKKALKFFTLTAESDPLKFLDKVPRYLNMRQLDVTEDYKESFMVACATFKHQTVFDPFKRKLVSLIDPADCGTDPKYCKNAGHKYDSSRALKVALGNMHPSKDEVFSNWYPPNDLLPSRSIWSMSYIKKLTNQDANPKEIVQFNSTKTYKKQVTKIEISNEQTTEVQEDLDMLAMYKNTKNLIVKTEEVVVKEIVEEKQEEVTSPVFKNPFLKTKLSKFAPTTSVVSGNTITKSRYFNKSFENNENTTATDETQLMESHEITDTSDDVNPKKRSHENLTDVTNIASDQVIDISTSQSTQLTQETKKLKLGRCRSVGLQKKTGGQKTLKHFFSQLNKD